VAKWLRLSISKDRNEETNAHQTSPLSSYLLFKIQKIEIMTGIIELWTRILEYFVALVIGIRRLFSWGGQHFPRGGDKNILFAEKHLFS
jgi:hypothetical protein